MTITTISLKIDEDIYNTFIKDMVKFKVVGPYYNLTETNITKKL